MFLRRPNVPGACYKCSTIFSAPWINKLRMSSVTLKNTRDWTMVLISYKLTTKSLPDSIVVAWTEQNKGSFRKSFTSIPVRSPVS